MGIWADNDCENCNAAEAIGSFNVDDVETQLCGVCCAYRKADYSAYLPVDWNV